ncbi:OmpA family protein [Mesorhizobium sp. M0408]|uniref:OmpA family protein n=1 Tax=Mesorhizobium sp. M0408 TaxID=2956942 RepID=UPI003337BAD3
MIEIARNVDPDYRARLDGIPTADPRMATLRQLLVGREISELSRVTHLLDEPEQLAAAVGSVLPRAAARAPHAQLGEALAPAVERAVQRSIQKSPRTLTDILYPVFLPAIRKSIGEKIDQTFQSLNETLRHIFTWHGLKWRLEAWRTGASFSEVVLKHSLVYRVEHVFLINRNSGLLIAHVTADNATSEDPQLISSMLSAIQDFVKDSFNEKGQSGLDTIRFGELRLWSEVGPFATLVAVIRGNPPEELHEIIRDVLLRIHDECSQALEQFDGDSSQLAGVETQLQTCVELKQEESNQGFPWLVVAAVLLVLIPAGGWFFLSWQSGQRWQAYVSRLGTQPGIIVAEQKVRDGQFYIAGLRDPLAADPQALLAGTQVDPARVHSQWQFYQSLDPEFVLKRLTASLVPPDSVRLSIVNDRIVAEGEAPDTWIDRARAAAQQLSAGGPEFDISRVRDVSPEARAAERWQAYVSRLEAQPGIIVAQQTARGGHFYISGLRDPEAADPKALLSGTGVDPARVHSQWQFYQSLDPKFVLKRLVVSLTPPKSVRLSIVNDRIVAEGEAPDTWIDLARAAARQLSAGGPEFDISRVRDVSPEARAAEHWQTYVSRLEAQAGIIVAQQTARGGHFYISGLRDPQAADPKALLSGTGVDPARVHSQWQFYQSLDPKFVVKRLMASLTPPDSVRLSIIKDRIVAQGEAPAAWIDRARVAAQQLSADGLSLEISELRELTPPQLTHLREAIQAVDILFDSGKAVPGPEQLPVLDKLANQLKELAKAARKAGVTAQFMLTGHSDETGRETAKLSISAARAETVRALLKKRGVDPELLLVRGAGTFEPAEIENSRTGNSANRRVSVTVNFH